MEVCHINVWGTVCCDNDWGIADAQVACRQLGLPNTGATTLTSSTVPDGSQVTCLGNIRCVGTESSLFNCVNQLSDMHYYSSRFSGYAGVICQDSKSYIFKLDYFFMYD